MPPRPVVFTDLDGTLLDHDTYSFEPAREALDAINSKNIPLVFCTSKTRAEIERWRRLTGNRHPFVSENGGAIYIPRDYFKRNFKFDRQADGYCVIELGARSAVLSEALKSIRAGTGILIKGISEMSPGEICGITGLDEESAALAKRREYGEPFVVDGNKTDVETIRREIEKRGFRYTQGGRLHHILGENDKGKAVSVLAGLYRAELGSVRTAGIGDSFNDLPMLEAVDVPILVQKPDGSYDERIEVAGLTFARGPGPQGWNSAILKLFLNF